TPRPPPPARGAPGRVSAPIDVQHAGRVRRFGTTELVYHWAQAIPYLTLAVSGSALLSAHFVTLSEVARERLHLLHLVAAVFQIALPLLVFLTGDRRALLANAREAFTWGRADIQWVVRMHLKPFYPHLEVPQVGKFNAGQKVNFMLVMLGIPAMAASGAVMYFVPGVLGAWYVHVALFAVLMPMLAVHLFMATINPSTRHAMRGILTGEVDRAWAAHHHAEWLSRVDKAGSAPEPDSGSTGSPKLGTA
ncbi:MAG: cytochrome b/b6 domain-containing protein, partial [Myxococcales bacterium]|nr:cytochrome b/b6 domain-containing protein [Myxococcales bacterium]